MLHNSKSAGSNFDTYKTPLEEFCRFNIINIRHYTPGVPTYPHFISVVVGKFKILLSLKGVIKLFFNVILYKVREIRRMRGRL